MKNTVSKHKDSHQLYIRTLKSIITKSTTQLINGQNVWIDTSLLNRYRWQISTQKNLSIEEKYFLRQKMRHYYKSIRMAKTTTKKWRT